MEIKPGVSGQLFLPHKGQVKSVSYPRVLSASQRGEMAETTRLESRLWDPGPGYRAN